MFLLLDNSFVLPTFLYGAAMLFFIITLGLVAATYLNLHNKKKYHSYKKGIRNIIEEWITSAIISDSVVDFNLPEDFSAIFKNQKARQILIDELVRSKGSFLGSASDTLIRLYKQLGLDIDSKIKLDSTLPHLQCMGIHELCVMEQKDELHKVYRLTNSQHKDVRIEAQTAVLQWYGFKGLRFLDVVSYPITEFQQLKLLELLRQLPFKSLSKLNKWLSSSNDTVVNFALKLAEHYKQSQVITEVEKCLEHKIEAVRVQAVKTLAVLGDPSTAELLTKAYQKERFTNRLNILQQLPKIATDEQRDFLIVQLHEGHEYLKLASAKVLAQCTSEGMEILEAKSYDEPIPYRDIYMHVKSEMER
jgi:hypothetical protein